MKRLLGAPVLGVHGGAYAKAASGGLPTAGERGSVRLYHRAWASAVVHSLGSGPTVSSCAAFHPWTITADMNTVNATICVCVVSTAALTYIGCDLMTPAGAGLVPLGRFDANVAASVGGDRSGCSTRVSYMVSMMTQV